MRRVGDLSREETADIVEQIVDVMYLDCDIEGDFCNPEKVLEGADFIDSVTTILNQYGLVPKEVERLH